MNTDNKVVTLHKSRDDKRIDARRQELLKLGVPENQVEGVLAQEEFRRLPIDQKVNHLMDAIHTAQRIYNETLRELSQEMIALHQNQESIADAFDMNLKAIEKHLLALGITADKQKEVMAKVTEEFMTEKAAQQAAKADPEKALVEKELEEANKESSSLAG